MLLTLQETKAHLRVDHDDENGLIEAIMAAATAATGNYLDNATLVLDAYAPAPVKSAALLLVADLYENRTMQVERVLYKNSTYESLLTPYRVLTA